ncbi:MAG: hypothetical protein ABIG61_02300 [Planctomycetota bacterium]
MGKKQKSDADQRQFWQMVMETWQSSGLSVRRFCKQEGLSEPGFYAWRKKLAVSADRQAAQSKAQPKPEHKDKSSSSDFIQVSLPAENHQCIELVLTSGNILHIGSDADSKVLSNVLSALRQAKLC